MPIVLQRTYERTYIAQVSFVIEDDLLRIRTAITAKDTGEVFPDPKGVSFPLKMFTDAKGELNQPLLESFCKRLADNVIAFTVDQAMFRDFTFHVIHMAHLLAVRMGISDYTYEKLIPQLAEFHTSIVIARLKSLIGQQPTGKGRHAKWSADSLSMSILMAMRRIKDPEHRTYPLVAKSLCSEFPESFPKGTADALKKLVARYDLDWQDLKGKASLTDSELILTLPPELQRLIAVLPTSVT